MTTSFRLTEIDRAPRPSGTAVLVVLALGLAAGCRSYPEKTEAALLDFHRGDFEQAAAAFADPELTGSRFLSGAEAGTAALAGGHWADALGHLHAAAAEVQELEDRALLSPQDLGESLVSFVVNESVQTYEGEGYERVMLHSSLALAYLALGSLDDVYVEARLSNQLLEAEEELYEKKYSAGGLGHFVSAVTYELLDRPDEAYVDYRRMAEKGVGEELAGDALVRLARRLHYTDDLARWEERYGPSAELPPDYASIVVIAGVGLGPYKLPTEIVLPARHGLIKWAVPRYERRPQDVDRVRLVLKDHGRSVGSTVIEDVAAVAHANLQDRLAWLAAKSAVRAAMKYEVTRQLGDEYGGWGALAGILLTLTTEKADLRGWQTLPDSWQAARVFVPPGANELELSAVGGDTVRLGRFGLEAGETLFVLARTIDRRVYAHVLGGLLLDGEPAITENDPHPEGITP